MSSQLDFRFGLETDPDLGKAAEPVESASWGWFEIRVDGINICRYVSGNSVHDRVHWYLLPVLEWFVRNWDSLLHEAHLPGRRETASARSSYLSTDPLRLDPSAGDAVFGWWQRHALRASAPGALLPDLYIRRVRNSIEFSWGDLRVPGIPGDVRFQAGQGRVLLDPKVSAQCLHAAIGRAVADIKAKVGSDRRLDELARDHAGLTGEHHEQVRIAWMMGWPVARISAWADSLLKELRTVMLPPPEPLVISRPTAALAMYGSMSPNIAEEDVARLTSLLGQAVSPGGGVALFAQQVEPVSSQPWNQGYELADAIRQSFALPDNERVDPAAILDGLGVRRHELDLSDDKVRAVAICGEGLQSVVAVNRTNPNNKTEPGNRFTLAHELCHLLFDREEGVPLAVASGPWAPADIEKRANLNFSRGS